MSKNKKIIIVILVVVLIVIGIIVASKIIEKSVTNREDFKFKVENIDSNPVNTVNFDNKNSMYMVIYFMLKWIHIIILIEELEVNNINHRALFEF